MPWTLDTKTWPLRGGGFANVGDVVTLPSPFGNKVTGPLGVYAVGTGGTIIAGVPYIDVSGPYLPDPYAKRGLLLSLWGDIIDPTDGKAIQGGGRTGPYVPPAPDVYVPVAGGGVAQLSGTLPAGGVTDIGGVKVTVDTTPEQFKAAQQDFQVATAAPAKPQVAPPPASAPVAQVETAANDAIKKAAPLPDPYLPGAINGQSLDASGAAVSDSGSTTTKGPDTVDGAPVTVTGAVVDPTPAVLKVAADPQAGAAVTPATKTARNIGIAAVIAAILALFAL